MASIRRHVLPSGQVRYHVRWHEPLTTLRPTGERVTRNKERTKSCRTRKAAQKLKREIETTLDLGKRWVPEVEIPVVTLDTLAVAFVQAADQGDGSDATTRFRASMVQSFLDFAGPEEPASALSLDLLGDFAASLPADGRQRATRYRKVREAERMWEWAHRRSDRFPGVPVPMRITGKDPDQIRSPPQVVAMDVPSWEDVDRMLAHLDRRPWHRRVGLILRYQGIRVSQALNLTWRDVDLEGGVLRLRAQVRGAKANRFRAVPLHPALAEEMQAWGPGDGLVFARKNGRPWRCDSTTDPFKRAWSLCGVDIAKWGALPKELRQPGDRAKARPTHAIRACVRTGLIRLGIEEAIALYMVGHNQGMTAAAYVPEDRPDTSPYWPRMKEAITQVPEVTDYR